MRCTTSSRRRDGCGSTATSARRSRRCTRTIRSRIWPSSRITSGRPCRSVDAERAVRYATRAGDRAALLLAYEEAARLYVVALELVDDEAGSSELLLRLGDVQARQGDIAASKETFVRAADTARAAGLPEHLARAALGYGGRFVWARAWGDERLVPLLEEALAALPEEDSELRVRLLARLAGGPLRDTHPPEARERMSQEAVDMARRLGDPATLAYALEGRYDANWGPGRARRAARDRGRADRARGGRGDAERAYAGHDCRFIALLEAGDAAGRAAESRGRDAAGGPAPPARTALGLGGAPRPTRALRGTARRGGGTPSGRRSPWACRAERERAARVRPPDVRAPPRAGPDRRRCVDAVERAADEHPTYPVWRYVVADVLRGARTDRRRPRRSSPRRRGGLPRLPRDAVALLPQPACRRLPFPRRRGGGRRRVRRACVRTRTATRSCRPSCATAPSRAGSAILAATTSRVGRRGTALRGRARAERRRRAPARGSHTREYDYATHAARAR